MTNEQIVQEIQAGINVKENLGFLYQQNIRYIRKIAKPFARNEVDETIKYDDWECMVTRRMLQARKPERGIRILQYELKEYLK